jgi:hypothetical protein
MRLPSSRERDRGLRAVSRKRRLVREGWLTWETMMTTAEPMTARGAHYTALLETIENQGATKLHAKEREQLLEAADALLFGEPENRRLLRSAEGLIESLEASGRWSAETCDQLREHVYGCDAPAGVA